MHRTDADDFARRARDLGPHAVAAEFADGFAGAKELAGQADVDDLLPLGVGHLHERGVDLQAGIVDQDVDGPEFFARGLKHGRHVGFAGHVGLMGEGVAAVFLDCFDDGLGLLGPGDVVDADLGDGGPQRKGDGFADAGAGPGDDGRLTFEQAAGGHLGQVHLRVVVMVSMHKE